MLAIASVLLEIASALQAEVSGWNGYTDLTDGTD